MKSKKEKIITYLLSGLLPVVIFIIAMIINKCYPFGDKLLNVYDSKDQYSSILLTAVRGIKSGNLFYTMNGGLGLNLYGMTTYYTTGILNVFALFANETNYNLYSTIMILVRFMCLGLSMCFYLEKKKIKPIYKIMLSVSYALMGFTSTYYYNFIWMDSIILLPLVIYGLEKLIEENKSLFYIITLSLAIISNFYIGYMICIFCILFFFYKLYLTKSKNKKEIIKTFIISSILSGLISCVILIPAFFALIDGKTVVYSNELTYFKFRKSSLSVFYLLTPGAYKNTEQIYGNPLVYTSLFVFANTLLYFFNTDIDKKNKKASLLLLLILISPLCFNLIYYMWHMFAKPIWYPHRYIFIISFFLIFLSSENLKKIKGLSLSKNKKIIISTVIIILIELSSINKFNYNLYFGIRNTHLGYFLLFSFFAIAIYIFLLGKNNKKILLLFLTIFFIDISINTINTVYQNSLDTIKKGSKDINIKKQLNLLKKKDTSFYRIDLDSGDYYNDGLLFDFSSPEYVSSVRNNKINRFIVHHGLLESSNFAQIGIESYDPSLIDLFGIKYIINDNNKPYRTNKNALSLGFTVDKKTRNYKTPDGRNYGKNYNILYSSFLNNDCGFYSFIGYEKFKTHKKGKEFFSTYSFKVKNNSLLTTSGNVYKIKINNKKYDSHDLGISFSVKKGDNISITYNYDKNVSKDLIYFLLLDYSKYDKAINTLKDNTSKLYNIKINQNHHTISGEIDVNKKYTYLFTTIGYHKGMKVYVDGKRVKPDIIDNAVIGLDLTKGHHKIIIDYIPQGFIPGLITSIIGIVGTIIFIRKRKK